MTKVINSVSELQNWSKLQKRQGKIVGLIPTMGALHAGHLSLIDVARENGADAVVVSVFVNPTQFGPNEDFDKYPRTFEEDLSKCEKKNVDVVFAPTVKDMYPDELTCWVQEEKISKGLCGLTRPIHFRGVTTVVMKLFMATLPDLSVFGQKDAQQVAVIQRMVRDLNVPVRICVAPIVRENTGLAVSSRNVYLTSEEKERALALSHSLFEAKKALEAGKQNVTEAIASIQAALTKVDGRIDYVEVLDANDMMPPRTPDVKKITIAIAVYIGTTRLIDNVQVTLP